MANELSLRPSAGTLAGTELFPILQGGDFRKVTVSQLADAIGGGGGDGTPGLSSIYVFKRSATAPTTPSANTGKPPPGWSLSIPAGTDPVYSTLGYFVGDTTTQSGSWFTPQRWSGLDGGSEPVTAEVSAAVARPVVQVLAKDVDIRSSGAALSGTGTDDQTALVNLKNAIVPGQRIRGPRGGNAGAAVRLTNTLEIRRQADWDFDRGTDIRLDKSSGTANAVEYNIDYTPTEFDTGGSPTATGDYRRTLLRGGRVYINGAASGYALAINKNGSGHKHGVMTTIEHVGLTGTLGALLIDSTRTSPAAANIETQWLVVSRCDMDGGITLNAEDGTVFNDCLSHGANGVTITKTFGAFNWGWQGGAVVNYGHNFNIKDGSFGQLWRVQMEHSAPGGPGTAISAYMIRIGGETYPSQGISIVAQNFGGGADFQHLLFVERGRRLLVGNCQWGGAGAAGHADGNSDMLIKVGASGSSPADDASGIILEPNQVFRNSRVVQAPGSKTDASRRMVIKTTGNRKFRTPHYGIWFPGFEQLTNTLAGSSSGPQANIIDSDLAALEFYITADGLVMSNGGIKRPLANGGLTLDLKLGTIPWFMLPYSDYHVPVRTPTRQGIAKLYVRRNGDGSANTSDALCGYLELKNDFSTEEYLFLGSWPAMIEPDYVTVA